MYRGKELYAEYLALDNIAMGMREIGVQVETANLDQHRQHFKRTLQKHQDTFAAFGLPDRFQLGAAGADRSLSKLFFDEFGCQPYSYSEKTQAPSLDQKALEQYGTQPGLIGDVARLVLGYRKNAKLLQSYVETLPLDDKGVVHPAWRIFGTRTGRWSATDPALQTIPAGKKKNSISLRNLFCSRKGKYLVEADFNALEGRICAVVYRASQLIEWFRQDIDVHSHHAKLIFGVEVSKEVNAHLRELAKTILYAFAYGSSPETIWAQMVLENPTIKLAAVRLVYDKLRTIHGDLDTNQKLHLARCRNLGYVEEIVSGRRQIYHNGIINPNECLNFPIQGLAGTLANRAILGIANELRPDENILAQVHDSILLEGPDPDRLSSLLSTHMAAPITAYGETVSFPIEVSVGTNWATLSKI